MLASGDDWFATSSSDVFTEEKLVPKEALVDLALQYELETAPDFSATVSGVPETAVFEKRFGKKRSRNATSKPDFHAAVSGGVKSTPIDDLCGLEQKKLVRDVQKFIVFNTKSTEKEEARKNLVLELGAKEPKRKAVNYKLLKEQRDAQRAKAAAEKEQKDRDLAQIRQKQKRRLKRKHIAASKQ